MKTTVAFYSEGSQIAGHLYLPGPESGQGPFPAIVLCHGFAGIKEILLPPYAEAFASNGFAALTFDYRGFGESEGERGRLVPAEQIRDIRNAITFLQAQPSVSEAGIGLWGTSFGGANAICTAAVDSRVACLSVQITFGSGKRMVTGSMTAEDQAKLHGTLAKAWQRSVLRNKPLYLTFEQILTDADSKAFYHKTVAEFPNLKTKLPLLTIRESLEYAPEEYIARVTAPILLIGADEDIVCPVEETRRLYAQANDPKDLCIISGARHYDVYSGDFFTESCGRALAWFRQHLQSR